MALVAASILTLSAAQLLDLATFIAMIHRLGPASEANPIVAVLFDARGYAGVAVAKVGLLALTTATVAVLTTRSARPRLAALVIGAGIIVGLVGGIANTVAMGSL